MSQVDEARFRATAGELQAFGATPVEAVDALMRNLQGDWELPIVIWPFNQGDTYFTDAQQARLQDLKQRRDSLNHEEREELEELIAASFDATIARTQALPLVKS